MAAHGLDTIEKYFTELRRFNMLRQASQITCPTLIPVDMNCEYGLPCTRLQSHRPCYGRHGCGGW